MKLTKSPIAPPSLKSVREGVYGGLLLLAFVVLVSLVKGYAMTPSDWALYGGASFAAGVYTALRLSVEQHGKRVILVLLGLAVIWALLVKHFLG
jgi:hypothetical protein